MTENLSHALSPPAWGWVRKPPAVGLGRVVFPTRVGMVRERALSQHPGGSFPHPRGDGPLSLRRFRRDCGFPHRGWSVISLAANDLERVFPTRGGVRERWPTFLRGCVFHPGMVRTMSPRVIGPPSFPHPRGDGPRSPRLFPSQLWFSPPAWGMVRQDTLLRRSKMSFPHPRGDGPIYRD